jgi:xylan 1,4-beta-xylosidase
MKYIICSILFFFGLKVSAQKIREIFFADPTIFAEGGKYYLTGTGGNRGGTAGFSVLESNDLKSWHLPAGGSDSLFMILTRGFKVFGSGGFWAPQIIKAADTYYLTYTANEQCALARSGSVLGPYTQNEVTAIDSSEKNIDPFIFKDDDGKYYLFHVRFNNGNYLWVAEFDIQIGRIKKETLKKCFDQTEPWEATSAFKSAPIMEGPSVIRLKNKYYLFYSANHFKNIDYAVGYAVSDSPYGPWIKQKNSPILHRSIVGENGSGHGDLFIGSDNNLYYVYHVHFDQKQITPRRTRIVPILKEWDPVESIYKFSVPEKKVIVPVLR